MSEQQQQQTEAPDDSFEKIAAALEIAEPVFEAIKDIPAMLSICGRSCRSDSAFRRIHLLSAMVPTK